MLDMNKTIIFLIITLLIASPKNTVKAAKVSETITVPAPSEIINNTLTTDVTLASTFTTPVAQVTQVPVPAPEKPKTLKETAEEMVSTAFGPGQFKAFDSIVQRESSWNPNAVNKSSGACGLPQALPCSKIADNSPEGQIAWMISYIQNRYQTPNGALQFWLAHNWY